MRADFEARCANYPQLAAAVQDRYLLTAMTERQLRMAITEPAETAGSRVDEDLVEVLLAEVRTPAPARGRASARECCRCCRMPWTRPGDAEPGTRLTLADYERTGGIEGAVAGSAQRAYDQLTPAQQSTARQVFIRLTADQPRRRGHRRPRRPAGPDGGKDAGQVQDVEAVLETFAAERLLTLAAGTVEISHEACSPPGRCCTRTGWLKPAPTAPFGPAEATAGEWHNPCRDPSYLYGGSRLESAVQAAARIGADARQAPRAGRGRLPARQPSA